MKLLSQAELSAFTTKQLCSNWQFYDRLIMAGDWKDCAITYQEATKFRDAVGHELLTRNPIAWSFWQSGLDSPNQRRWTPAQYFNDKRSLI
jgi:hypothetical protein